jgi:hypothetical protein
MLQVRYEENPALSAAIGSFPARVDASRALALGLEGGDDAASIVRAYAEDFPSALGPGVELVPPPPVSDPAMGAAVSRTCRTVVLITGGGTGIGKAVALRLARSGWQRAGTRVSLVLTGRRRQPLEEAVAEIRAAHGEDVDAMACPADLGNAGDVERLFSTLRREYGRLDLLFNNAGAAMPPTPVHLTTYAEWRRVVGINLDAAFHVAKEAFVRPCHEKIYALRQFKAQALALVQDDSLPV